MLVDEGAAARRNDAITRLGLLERAGDPGLSAITRLTTYVTGATAAAVHIIDDAFQHRVAGTNAPLGDHPRQDSMCRLVIDSNDRIVCADATADDRFGYSSFVTGPAPVRFYASVPLRTADGTVFGSLCAFDTVAREISDEQLALMDDLAEQAATQIQLTRLAVQLGDVASHDPLTGAVNRLVLGDRLAQAFARRLRHGGHTFLAVVDVDRFKLLNDVHGHAAGDQVLVAVAQRLQTAVRSHDTVARVGGDEFVVVAELDDESEPAEALLDRLQEALSGPVAYGDQLRPVPVSIGGVLAHPGDDVESLLRRADAAMYADKARPAASAA